MLRAEQCRADYPAVAEKRGGNDLALLEHMRSYKLEKRIALTRNTARDSDNLRLKNMNKAV